MTEVECPPEALVLLDEAIEALPPGSTLRQYASASSPASTWAKPFEYPILSIARCDPENIGLPTWTIVVNHLSGGFDYLEWWDDHWVRIRLGREIVWKGSRAGP